MPKTRLNRKETFFWQGLLIILPALLLAVVGLFSLRQDRILAEHDAAEQAKKIARSLAQSLLPAALQADVPSAEAVARFRSAPVRADEDPILACTRAKDVLAACLIDQQKGLVYPPPLGAWPVPKEFDVDELSPDQQAAWSEARAAVFVAAETAAALQAYQRLLDSSPPGHFAAVSLYQCGLLRMSQDDPEQARKQFESIIKQYPNALGESGLPIRTFAELRLLQLAAGPDVAPAEKAVLINSLCSRVVLAPSPLTRFVLGKVAQWEAAEAAAANDAAAPENGSEQAGPASISASTAPAPSVAAAWQKVWAAHEMARSLQAGYRGSAVETNLPGAGGLQFRWLDFADGPSWLAAAQAEADHYWVLAWSEENVRRRVGRILEAQPLPAYFGLAVEIGGRKVVNGRSGSPVLAAAAHGAAGSNDMAGLTVAVQLTDADALYARQRTRSLWFGSLIGLSVVAVMIGFASAWRAFVRQQHLSEMKTNFVSSVSHELRAPIASVRLMAEELDDIGPQDRHKNKEYHRFIVQECRRLSGLIENVLDFARHEQGRKQYEFEPTDLASLVRETAGLMQAYGAERQITVAARISGEPVPIEGDGRALQQILVNLTDNAIKHSPPGSAVELGLDFQPDRVFLWVEDHGEGIPPEDHERIFERFYRRGSELRRETQGVGLGLAIVRYVAEAHGGKVTVRSQVGQGSRFTVELPLSPETKP
ncbi:MAG: hypothetical protein HY674_07540 [Chloroflexi bacterium]|nr:hypothetical protein [Chloroflexota bacterium]